ncbi:MAG: choice-of-anchor E domain-containing protein [Tepidisphaeraceae bacterium]
MIVLAGLGLSWTCYGSTISFFDSVPFQGTNWTKSVTIPRFNPALGTLNSVSFKLDAYLKSTAFLENTGPSPALVTATLTATITLSRPDLTIITYTTPIITVSDNFTAFDLVLDFGGTSGKTHAGLTANDSVVVASPPPATDLALFTGIGNIIMPVTAKVKSVFSGDTGNLAAGFSSGSSAAVTVTYNYSSAIPTPKVVWAGGVMLAGLILHHFRRRLRA